MPRLRRFSRFFRLGKAQGELDFVDIPVNGDLRVFVDPFAISQRRDRFSRECHDTLIAFFDNVVSAIRRGDPDQARTLLSHLREPNETRLGLSRSKPQGAGIGQTQSEEILGALVKSTAVRTGFLNSLEETELMVDGIGPDKISDLTTNVTRGLLAKYTRDQCELHGVPVQQVALGPYYSLASGQWGSEYFDLPVAAGTPILLVPKAFARVYPAYDHQQYYRHFVLPYLEAEHLQANTSLVRALKSGRRVVYKKDLEAIFPKTKENLFAFSRDHPEVLQRYRERLAELERRATFEVSPEEERLLARALADALRSIPAGSEHAESYHSLIVGGVEFLFFPNLLYPRKEREIHQGRKRIDIVMENGAQGGIFFRLHDARHLPCAYVVFECKNYQTDVANPELDQLAGRFSTNRGMLGFLCCRRFENRNLFIERCRDTLRDGRGLILPLNDDTIVHWLGLINQGRRHELEGEVSNLVAEVWLS